GVNSKGQMIPFVEVELASSYDLQHGHREFLELYDGGKMDGADLNVLTCNTGPPCAEFHNPAFRYVVPSQVQPYFDMAEQYTFADRMFQTNQGPSFPAHQFIIAGTSAPSVGSHLFAAENPRDAKGSLAAGCLAVTGTTEDLIDPSGKEAPSPSLCFEHPV